MKPPPPLPLRVGYQKHVFPAEPYKRRTMVGTVESEGLEVDSSEGLTYHPSKHSLICNSPEDTCHLPKAATAEMPKVELS
eukprot:scaffold1376_cov257-Pinguiococcus_pyrenoidosus.AAC.3